MRCRDCEGKMTTRVTTARKPYHFKMSGLSDVYLVGVELSKCSKCGTVAPTIPALGQLLDAIALDIIHKPAPLTGEEIRFLRKSAKRSARAFSKMLGVDHTHLSKVENGHTSLGATADKLVRVLAMACMGKQVRKLLLEEDEDAQAAGRKARERSPAKRRAQQDVRGRWVVKAA